LNLLQQKTFKSVYFYLLTYLTNINIDINMALFRQYFIHIVSTSKKWYQNITTS